MRVINTNIGTSMLSHFCPNCGNEVFHNNTFFDTKKCSHIKQCEYCGEELEFPNVGALIALLGR